MGAARAGSGSATTAARASSTGEAVSRVDPASVAPTGSGSASSIAASLDYDALARSADDPPLPGIDAPDDDLAELLERAVARRGDDYEPRTEHFDDAGEPRYTNRLIFERSPYLLQHAHNPVNWFPWGEAAFARARATNKPIFLSVGYSTCHWCHVMERESFEDEEIAAYLNEHYVSIKVDREERPDIDDIYMSAVHTLSGGGGWPMTLVLTPEGKPFFAATYLPPRQGVRGAQRGLDSILEQLATSYAEEPERLVAQAERVTQRMVRAAAPARPSTVPGPASIRRGAAMLGRQFDGEHGGFGDSTKFPRPPSLAFLLRYHRRTGDDVALRMVTQSLDAMADGGIRDQLGGGFHRYATDAQWRVPHFEKMLYDNAQLVRLYAEGWQATGDDRYAAVARDTADYLLREMEDPHGGFYSATDADSEAPSGETEEGWFFTWTPSELEAALSPEQAQLVSARFGISDDGEVDGRNVLHVAMSIEEIAAAHGRPPEAIRQELAHARAALYDARAQRPRPLLDDKLLTSWNGLTIDALAFAGRVLDERRYLESAIRAGRRILRDGRTSRQRLWRVVTEEGGGQEGVLSDYAYLVGGLISLFEATGDETWLREALALQEGLDAAFWDEESGGYFMTRSDGEALVARPKPARDGVQPSGNAAAAENLLRLAELTLEDRYRTRAEQLFAAFGVVLRRNGMSSPALLSALDFYLDTPKEIVLVSTPSEPAVALDDVLDTVFLPYRAVVRIVQGGPGSSVVPYVAEKEPVEGRPTAFVCERGRCERPTTDPGLFRAQISPIDPLTLDGEPPPPITIGFGTGR